MIEKILINLFVASIELITVYEIIKRFREDKSTKISVLLIVSAIYLLASVIFTVIAPVIFVLIGVNSIILFCYTYVCRIKTYKRCIAVFIYMILGIAVELFVFTITSIAFAVSPAEVQMNLELYLISAVTSKFLLFIVIKIIFYVVKPNNETVAIKLGINNFILSLFSVLVLAILSYLAYESKNSSDRILVLITSVLVVANNIFTYIIYENSVKRDRALAKEIQDSNLFKRQKEEYAELIDAQQKSNQEIHDIKHKMYTLRSTINSENEIALKLIGSICEIYNDKQIIKYTEINDLDILLNVKKNRAKERTINLKYVINIDNQINIESMDLCVIFGNLIDNAIENTPKNKDIIFNVFSKQGYLFINGKNKININKQIDINTTTKENKDKMHGFGLKNVKKIVKKYDGSMSTEVDEDEFNVVIMLKPYHSLH